MKRAPACILVFAVLAFAPRAAASPSFARKYNVSCHTCHETLYPELNGYGRQFKENGYQLPPGAEPAYADRDRQSPGTIAERIGLWRDLPLSARATGYVQVPLDAAGSGRNAVDLKLLNQLYLIGGGALWKNVSVFFSASAAPTAMLHHASIGVHNLFSDEGYLNVRAGDLLLWDYLRPEHRGVTRAGNLAATTRVGRNPTVLDTSHLGIEVFGRLLRRHVFYQLAVVQGAQGTDGLSDLDSGKDVFGLVQWNHFADKFQIGAFGYYGRTQILDTARLVQIRFTDPFFVAGGQLELHFGPVMLFGYGLYNRHDNPNGNGKALSYVGARADVRVAIRRDLLAQARFDGVFWDDATLVNRAVVSGALTYLLLTNLKVSAELDADVLATKNSTFYLVVDAAM